MREIKFRVWNTISKTMKPFSEIKRYGVFAIADGLNSDDFIILPLKNSILNEYTGTKDKNDVEIYEGDIVVVTEIDEDSCLGREFSYKGVVSYANSLKLSQYVSQYPSSFCLISKSFYREQALLFNDRWDYEVIGNIYENPDLIKG